MHLPAVNPNAFELRNDTGIIPAHDCIDGDVACDVFMGFDFAFGFLDDVECVLVRKKACHENVHELPSIFFTDGKFFHAFPD